MQVAAIEAGGKTFFIIDNESPHCYHIGNNGGLMRIIAKGRLRKYWEAHGNEQAQPSLVEWYHFCEKQKWSTPQDVKNTFRHASFVAGNLIVFNVKGNNYRIVCAMDYQRQAMFIKFVGTHVEYDAIEAEVVK